MLSEERLRQKRNACEDLGRAVDNFNDPLAPGTKEEKEDHYVRALVNLALSNENPEMGYRVSRCVSSQFARHQDPESRGVATLIDIDLGHVYIAGFVGSARQDGSNGR